MPRLAVLAACHDVLIDDESNPTLVGVFCALDVTLPKGTDIPRNALTPKKWCVLSMWLAADSDLGRTFIQKMQIFLPDGNEFGGGSEEFTLSKRSHTMKMRVSGFPIGVQGEVVIKLWLESLATKVTAVHEYRIHINHLKAKD